MYYGVRVLFPLQTPCRRVEDNHNNIFRAPTLCMHACKGLPGVLQQAAGPFVCAADTVFLERERERGLIMAVVGA